MAVYRPQVTSITLSPNPVNINSPLFVSVKVSEVEVQMFKLSKIAGSYKSGESVTINIRKEVV